MKKLSKKLSEKGKIVPKIGLNYEVTKLSKEQLDTTEKQVKFVRQFFNKKQLHLQEKLVMVMLDRLDYPIGVAELYKGTTQKIDIDDRDILMLLIETKADKFYLCHNHPTDNKYPSSADVLHANTLSQKINYLEISEYVDDIIITKKQSFSLMEHGLILS